MAARRIAPSVTPSEAAAVTAPGALGRLRLYAAERFTAVLWAGAAAFAALGIAAGQVLSGRIGFPEPGALPGAGAVILVALRLRAMDDVKDLDLDRVRHPGRPLARGAVTAGDLRRVIAGAIVLEALLSLLAGAAPFLVWIAVLAYSVLMYREYFLGRWTAAHRTLDVAGHSLIVPLAAFYLVVCVDPSTVFARPAAVGLYLGLVYLTILAGQAVRERGRQ